MDNRYLERMGRTTEKAILALALAGCAAAPLRMIDPRVATRPGDQGVAVTYSSWVCAVTIHDETGVVHDLEMRDGKGVPIDMVRSVPDVHWHVRSYTDTTLLMVLAMPPGRYSITDYAVARHSKHPGADFGVESSEYTDCPNAELAHHAVRLPFEVKPGALTILDLPKGAADFDTLENLHLAKEDSLERTVVAGWLPLLERAETTTRAALLEGQRQQRGGYDVYPDCNHAMAVVRTTGTPFSYYADPMQESLRNAFKAQALPHVSAPSLTKVDFFGGCTRPAMFVYILDPKDRNTLASKIGEWLVHDDLQGEVDVVVETAPKE